MTFAAILADVYRRLTYQSTPAADVVTRLKAFANETQREIVREPGVGQMLYLTLPLASVADQAEYGVPGALSRVLTVRDTANQVTLREISEAMYRLRVPDPASFTGTPYSFANLAVQPVALRPSNASELFIKSDNAGDVQVANFEVLTSAGEIRTGQVTLTGLTAISLSVALTTIIQVTDLYLASAAVGTVTLHEDSGVGTELARISVGQTRSWIRQIALVPTPSSVLTYQVTGERELTDLVNDTDEPILPPRFHPMISIGTRKKEYEYKGDESRFMMAAREWDDWRGQLRQALGATSDGLIVPGGRRHGSSSLGPWFPADRFGPF